MFSPDTPIDSFDADDLERGDFARNLADALAGWKDDRGLVVALNGAWGDGKTSVMNLVTTHLSTLTPPPPVVHFDPWRWITDADISVAFFHQLGQEIGALKQGDAKWAAIGGAIDKYATALSRTSTVESTATAKISPFAGAILGALSGSIAVAITKTVVPMLLVAVALVSFSGWIGSRIARLIVSLSSPERLSESQAKTKVVKFLKRNLPKDCPVVVVIDDIDRLSPEEIWTVLRLVKANGDLPHVVYVLLFDREVVTQVLERF